MKAPCWIVRWWQRFVSPVPQDTAAVLYGMYRGKVVMMRPVLSAERPWMVDHWEKDIDQCAVIDKMLDEKKGEEETNPAVTEAGPSPAVQDSQPPPDFNPAGVAGL